MVEERRTSLLQIAVFAVRNPSMALKLTKAYKRLRRDEHQMQKDVARNSEKSVPGRVTIR